MDPDPPYAHVFCDDGLPMPPLTKLGDGSVFSMLHTKYWDKSIDRDECEWVEAHGRLKENDGSEVVQGCFALHLGIKTLMVLKLWVRQDYWRIYDLCHRHCEAVRTDHEQERGNCRLLPL